MGEKRAGVVVDRGEAGEALGGLGTDKGELRLPKVRKELDRGTLCSFPVGVCGGVSIGGEDGCLVDAKEARARVLPRVGEGRGGGGIEGVDLALGGESDGNAVLHDKVDSNCRALGDGS